MDRISELKRIISDNFNWNKARLDCFVRMLLALFAVRTVNLSEIALAFASKAEISSRYKRLQRFFKEFKLDYVMVARWAFKLFFADKPKVYLTIDRTNWFWGKGKINILTLAVAYEGIAVPLLWQLLNKAGNATANEHIEIIRRFVEIFGKEHIAGILGDREFASGKLFKWCNKCNVPFYIRIKDNSRIQIKKRDLWDAKKLFNHLNPKEQGIFNMAVELFGEKVYLAGSRSERGELMIVATNKHPKNAVAIYLRRWEIECLFHGLKGRGFRFEETHMTALERIEKLMAVLVVGFCWAHKVGEWKAAVKKPILLKKHKDSLRPQNSFFRYGFDFIREAILNPFTKKAKFKKCINALSYLTPIQELAL